jgi:hypothetical protein
LYKETRLAYTISDPQKSNNYLVFAVNQDLGNCILFIYDDFEECTEEENKKVEKTNKSVNSRAGVWKMFFDGASSYEGAKDGVLFVVPGDDYVIPFFIQIIVGN